MAVGFNESWASIKLYTKKQMDKGEGRGVVGAVCVCVHAHSFVNVHIGVYEEHI